jgi:hypothetical protein
MNWLIALMILVAVCRQPGLVLGQLTIATNVEPQRMFFGQAKNVPVIIHNAAGQSFAGAISTRIFQTSSATAVRLGETPWKQFQALPGQTVVESAPLDFPPVKAETKFLVQWVDNTNHIIGETAVWVYPKNLLAELKPLAGGQPLGIFDPQNQLKPLLKNLKVDFENMENSDLEKFSGKLAIIGPFQSKPQMREGLASQILALAKKGAAIVWLQPPPEPSPRPSPNRWEKEKLRPSFYSVPESQTAVVIVQPDLVADLAGNPQAQLNLVYFCKLALHPQPPTLPDLLPQP